MDKKFENTHYVPKAEKSLVHFTKTCPCNIQRFFSGVKIENFVGKFFDIFLVFAQNIDCGYTLEPPRRGGSKHRLWVHVRTASPRRF